MTFDIGKIRSSDYAALSEGGFMPFRGSNGLPLTDDGKTVGVVLRGRNSREGLAAVRRNGNARLADARAGRLEASVERNEQEFAAVLAACTVSWTFDQLDGEPFPCTLENARRLWTDDRFRSDRERAEEFVSSDANFTKG